MMRYTVLQKWFEFFETILVAESRTGQQNTGQHTNARRAGGKRDKIRRSRAAMAASGQAREEEAAGVYGYVGMW
jgi:hypothetical protein